MKSFLYICLFCIATSLVSCKKDKGNYSYKETNDIEISNISEQYDVLGFSDTLKITPKIISKNEGEIEATNENYSFTYAYGGKIESGELKYVALDSTYPKNLNYYIKLVPKVYNMTFIVTDKRTGVQTFKPFKLNVNSAFSEGWLVMCNEGPTERLRLDMISVISPTRSIPLYDFANNLGLPNLHSGTKISFQYFFPNQPKISLLTKSEGAYNLDHKTLQSGPSYHMKYEFGDKNATANISNMIRVTTSYYLAVIDNNLLAQYHLYSGAIFEFPTNTTLGNKIPEFKISNFIVSDPKISLGSNNILAYDITNKRFVDWSSGRPYSMQPLVNPSSNMLFDYNTGKDIVYMESSLLSNSTAYTILKKDNNYSLYGNTFVRASPVSQFVQSYYADLNIPEIQNATKFAFHSTLPYMFYATDNKLYQFDLVTKQTKLMKDFGDKKISMIKFNIFKFVVKNRPTEYFDQQYDLLVGLEDSSLPEESSGILQFYKVPPLNADINMFKEYTGFAKIVDVVYKEAPIL